MPEGSKSETKILAGSEGMTYCQRRGSFANFWWKAIQCDNVKEYVALIPSLNNNIDLLKKLFNLFFNLNQGRLVGPHCNIIDLLE